jgi:hypothetical protein
VEFFHNDNKQYINHLCNISGRLEGFLRHGCQKIIVLIDGVAKIMQGEADGF